ncbi:hypothetical protein [Georgenia halophila]|uniref:hypothetical protein n=1 Tax=Georgenia halophila TaxID=620889 RepID=UPI0031E993EB
MILLLVIAVAIVVAVRTRRRTRERRAGLRAWAHARGWSYADDAPRLGSGLRGGPFGTGHSRSATEAVWGTYADRPAVSFRYTYKVTSGSGKNRRTRTYHHHVLALELPERLPYIELSAENFLTRTFGNDIELEHHAFNDAWRVRGEDRRTTYDVVHPQMMERLMRPDLRGANLLYEGGRIFLWRRGQPDQAVIDTGLRRLTELLDLTPEFVWDDARNRRGD